MQVENISSTNKNLKAFQGRVAIVGDLSAIPAKAVREAAPNLKKLFADKPYDLYIKENYNYNCIDFIVENPKNFGRKTPDFIYTIPKKDKERLKDPNAYYSTAENAIINYERRIHDNSLGVKLKKFFKNLGQKFKEALQDENEI